MRVPFFRPELTEPEIEAVAEVLRSGWLTSGPRVAEFERSFAQAVGAKHALAVNSCTAAMHLALEALGLERGQGVLVPTMTFAATAEVVRYFDAVPVLVDCDPVTGLIDLADAEAKLEAAGQGRVPGVEGALEVVGWIPVHVGGLMVDLEAQRAFASRHGLWTVEDAAHAFPAAWRAGEEEPWTRCGEGTAEATCFSFYANKTLTTGEGGMLVSADQGLIDRARVMCLHGLTKDAWRRYGSGGNWDYRIIAPGFKYNLTDIGAALGCKQLERAESMRAAREEIANAYREALEDEEAIERPPFPRDRVHSWHLFPIRLRLERLRLDRDAFVAGLRERGIGFSVHWRPLHLHPYYEAPGWRPEHCPHATALWRRLVSLPIFPGMREEEVSAVVEALRSLCRSRP